MVILFYGSALFMYMKPKSKDTNTSDEIMGLSYGVVTPMLNPIIYILRNKKVKEAVKKESSESTLASMENVKGHEAYYILSMGPDQVFCILR